MLAIDRQGGLTLGAIEESVQILLPERFGPLVARVLRVLPQLTRYAGVSGLALTLDFSVFLALSSGLGAAAAQAGVIGYTAGLLLHYLLSTWLVFGNRGGRKSHTRRLSEFAATGLVGIVVTAGVIAMGTSLFHISAIAAKAAAVAISFLAVFWMRRKFVFAA